MKIDKTFEVFGSYGQLTVDKETGVVLNYTKAPDEGDDYSEIAIIDVAELRSTLGEVPNMIDIILVGYTTRLSQYERPDRRAYIEARLDDPQEVDPTLAAFIKAELSLAA